MMNLIRGMNNWKIFQNHSLCMNTPSPSTVMKRFVPCGQFRTFRLLPIVMWVMMRLQIQPEFRVQSTTFVPLFVRFTFQENTSPKNSSKYPSSGMQGSLLGCGILRRVACTLVSAVLTRESCHMQKGHGAVWENPIYDVRQRASGQGW